MITIIAVRKIFIFISSSELELKNIRFSQQPPQKFIPRKLFLINNYLVLPTKKTFPQNLRLLICRIINQRMLCRLNHSPPKEYLTPKLYHNSKIFYKNTYLPFTKFAAHNGKYLRNFIHEYRLPYSRNQVILKSCIFSFRRDVFRIDIVHIFENGNCEI